MWETVLRGFSNMVEDLHVAVILHVIGYVTIV